MNNNEFLDINLKKTWEIFDKEFQIEKEYHIFTLCILIRYTLEKEGKYNEAKNKHYNLMIHNFIHYNSRKITHNSFYLNIIKIFNKFHIFDETYKINNINKIISQNTEYYDIYITDKNEKSGKEFKIKNLRFQGIQQIYIKNRKILSIKNKIYEYKFLFTNNISKDFFCISNEKLKIRYPYEGKFSGKWIQGKYLRYYFYDTECVWERNFNKLKELLKKGLSRNELNSNFKNNDDITTCFSMEGKSIPFSYDDIKERDTIKLIHSYDSKLIQIFNIENEKYFPFIKNYLNSNTPIIPINRKTAINYFKKYKNAHNYNKNFVEEYIIKNKLDENNDFFVEVFNGEYNNFNNYSEYQIVKFQNKWYIKKYLQTLKTFVKICLQNVKNMKLEGIKDFMCLTTKKALLLYGPGGHGKTHEIKEFIKLNYKKYKFNIIAPSWKALSRYQDIQKYENVNIQTYQKIIKYHANYSKCYFKHCTEIEKINSSEVKKFLEESQFIIIDEISMIDNWDFIDNINDNIRIILMGDNKQIPPIGQNMPSIWLEEIFKKYKLTWNFEKKDNFRLMWKNKIKKIDQELEAAKKINDLIKEIRNENFSIENDKYSEYIIMLSFKDKIYEKIEEEMNNGEFKIIVQDNIGPIGTRMLNALFSKNSVDDFAENDIIMFNKNGKNNKYYNQTEGKIVKITNEDSKIKYKILKISSKKENFITLEVKPGEEPFDKSFAINAHKAQGSSFPNVLVIIDRPVSYNWLYSAVSRTSNKLKIMIINDDKNITFIKSEEMKYKKSIDDFITDYEKLYK